MMVNKVGLIFAAIRAKVFHWKKVDKIGEGDMWEKVVSFDRTKNKKDIDYHFLFLSDRHFELWNSHG